MKTHLVDELLLQYRFGTLDAQASANVAEHLRTCSECTRTYAKLGESIERLGAYDVETSADEATLARALERATAALELSGRSQRAPPSPAPEAVAPPTTAPLPVALPPPSQSEPWPGLMAWLGVVPGASGRPLRLTLAVVLALSVTWVGGGALFLTSRTAPLETRVRGESSLEAGGHGLVHVEVRRGELGVPDAPLSLSLVGGKGRVTLFEGRTDAQGNAAVTLSLPSTAEATPHLEVKVRAGAEEDLVDIPLQLQQSFKVHLSTDKPLYQPGQTIHLRSLVMRSPRPEPANGKSVLFEVRDAKNVRLASKSVPVSTFGVASFDLELSDEVALGTWKLTAAVDGTVAEAQVEVSRYTLPKFKLAIAPRKESYLAGERLEARVTARYFFGQPVVGAQLRALVMLQDGSVLAEVKGKTDADGTFKLVAELPSKLAATRPEPVVLQLEATDAAGQQEQAEHAVTVSRELLTVEVLGDGTPVSGVENAFFVFTTTPDGRAVPCQVEVQPLRYEYPNGGAGLGGLGLLAPPRRADLLRLTPNLVGVQGTLDRELATKVINAHLGQVLSCFERARVVGSGRLVAQWQVSPEGTVSAAKTKLSSLQSAPLESCVLNALKSWRFPSGGGVVTAPFIFTAAAVAPPPPAPEAVTVGEPIGLRTSENGLGQFQFVAPQGSAVFRVKVEDGEGRKATREVSLPTSGVVSLTTDKAFYRPGEPVVAQLRTAVTVGAWTLEARSGGRLIHRAPLTQASGGFTASLVLPKDFVGALDLGLDTSTQPAGFSARDLSKPRPVTNWVSLRRVMVAEPSGLVVKLSTDKPAYRPGEPATLRFTVTDAQGQPKVAALGLSVVDESLFALTSSKPELVRAFFLVERALLAPRFGTNVGALLSANSWTQEQQLAGRLLLALTPRDVLVSTAAGYLESTVGPKLAQRQAEQRFWSRSAGIVGVAAALLLALVLVIAISTRLSPVAGGAFLGVALLAGAWMRLPWQLQVGGALLLSFSALYAARRENAEVPASLFFLPALCLAFGLLTWPPRALEEALAGPDGLPAIAEARPTASPKPPDVSGRVEYKAAAPEPSQKPALQAMMKKTSSLEGSAGAAGIGLLGTLGGKADPAPEPPRREVRIRQHFPETLYVNPQLVADEHGVAELTFPLADSITAWRISALASSADGKLGTLDAPLKVFQPFFVDLDVPVALVRGDEATVPIALYNYLDTPQDVRLEVERAPWFELVGEAPSKVTIAPNGVEGRSMRIRVLQAGEHQLNVRADGSSESDVVARQLLVTEAGREDSVTVSGVLRAGKPTQVALLVPEASVGATQVLVKLFPSLAATALDGIEGTLAQPTGCFEQTSAATYPNVLVEEFLRREGRLTPELERRTGRLLSLGYQRLVGFEVSGGGFEWFGRAPANQVLSAYGLMEFSDLRRVLPIDSGLIDRTQRFLFSRQQADGSWNVDQQMIADGLWRSEHKGRVTVTAYITWALAESGVRSPELERAQGFLSENLESTEDAYTLALMTAGFAKAAHPEAARAAGLLAKKAQRNEGLVSFKPAGATAYYGRGAAGEVETTALAAYALAKAGTEPALVKGSLDFLLARRSGHGAWPSTQGTILALKALLAGTESKGTPTVTVSINGTAAGTFALTGGTAKVLPLGDRARHGMNTVELSADLDAPFLATATFTLPWRQQGEDDGKPLALSVEYGTRKADVGGIVPVKVQLAYRGTEASGMALVELGIPAGLTPLPEDLEALRSARQVAKYQLAGGKVRLYLDRLQPGAKLALSLRFKATSQVDTQGVGSLAYLYYEPAVRAEAPPVAVAVR